MDKEEKVKRAINELRDSYELHQRGWAKRCLDTIEEELETKDKMIELMTDFIDSLNQNDEYDFICYLIRDVKDCREMPDTKDKCKRCIKEYFKRKINNES